MTSQPHLHFHLGPVGGFIAEARRTRDYWAGSFLLSWLVAHAMAAVRKAGGTVVIPVVEIEDASGASDRGALGGDALDSGLSIWQWLLFRRRDKQRPDYCVEPMLGAVELASGTLLAAEAVTNGDAAKPFLGTLSNHFAAAFPARSATAAPDAGVAAAAAVRKAWIRLASAVRTVILDDFKYLNDSSMESNARRIWTQQIGDEHASPFWEIYWAVSDAVADDALDMRKAVRWSPDMQAPLPSHGNFCSMFGSFVDISGLERPQRPDREQRDRFNAFWSRTRSHLIKRRYGREAIEGGPCLDLRPNESLCAPALVKRLFPLLAVVDSEALQSAIGWKPEVRNVRFDPNATRPAGHEPPGNLDVQSLLYWPSTSYIAAAHWVARAQRSAPDLCAKFADAIGRFGHQYAVAESNQWLRAVRESVPGNAPLGSIDGAMLHANRIERTAKADEGTAGDDAGRSRHAQSAINLLQQLYASKIVDGGVDVPGIDRAERKVGRPPDYFAIIRADGDHIGGALKKASADERRCISRLFIEWAGALRGDRNATDPDGRLGPVAARNGVILYAGADEIMAFAPVEDASDIARAIYDEFVRCRDNLPKRIAPDSAVRSLTVSVSVLYAHIRAPLRWAIDESTSLLDDVAKEAGGRNAVAYGLFDIGGGSARWAARWDSPRVKAFEASIWMAARRHGWLWSNQFYHRLSERLRAFLIPDDKADYPALVKYLRDSPVSDNGLEDMTGAIIRRCVEDSRAGVAVSKPEVQHVVDLLTPFATTPAGDALQPRSYWGRVSMAPLEVLRTIGANWCKDLDSSPVSMPATVGHSPDTRA